jgi:hypothetical protein
LQSSDLSAADWLIDSGTKTANFATSPDGTSNAGRYVTAAVANLRQVITVTASTQYTFSFYAKANGGTQASYRVFNISGAADIVATTSYFSSINSSTWTRITVNFTTPVGCTSIGVYMNSNASADTLLWGAQLEAGSFASSYIPTTTVAVPRNSDVLTYPVSGNISGTTGSVYLETAKAATSAAMSGNTPILGFGDVGVNGNILLKQGGTSALLSHDVTGFITLGVSIADTTNSQKMAAAYAPSVVTGAVSGTVGSPVATDGNFNAGASFYVGCIPTPSGNSYFGTIRNVRIYQTQLSSAQLQAVTA